MGFKVICSVCDALPWNNGAKRRCICHGFNLDIGCGEHKNPGFLGMDRRGVTNVDFVWDIEKVPWPFPGDVADRILASHILEHISPKLTLPVWDEMHRIMKPDGQLLVVVPHGQSYGMLQDPTHESFYVEATFTYFCPEDPSGLYNLYKPLPWRLLKISSFALGNIETVLSPLKDYDKSKHKNPIGKTTRSRTGRASL